ncbi:MAG: hypothetical protein KBF45_10310 [Cyclobacteriaceae bacterium]|jgi:hypothetical protein|nr:hypothetical protein [Cyclobacteriaceae bacterium]
MKINFSLLLVLIVGSLSVTTVTTVSAQEGVPHNEIPEIAPYNNNDPSIREEKPLLYEPESKPITNTVRDQPTNSGVFAKTKSKNPEPPKAVGTKPEEDALSFNFLYYIIQKFKISDIVEQ